jgi:hypothetical protein
MPPSCDATSDQLNVGSSVGGRQWSLVDHFDYPTSYDQSPAAVHSTQNIVLWSDSSFFWLLLGVSE